MRYDHDYEFAFYANRPEYLKTGKTNPCNYRVTGCFNTGDYWTEDADNREELEAAFRTIGSNETIVLNTIAMQNKYGQLIWSKECGFAEGIAHPKYMDKMKALEVRTW